MKKIMIILTALAAVCSCDSASELPPLDDGFARDFILPDPVNLTMEDREYLDALEKEHDDAIKNQ